MSNQLPKGLSYVNGRLSFSGKAIFEIVEAYGTPAYVYSEQILDECLAQLPLNRPGVTVCFAVKANNNLSILERLHKSGVYFDVASSEELRRVAAAAKPQALEKCVATGPAKSVSFLNDCLRNNVFSIHAECEEELQRIEILRQKCPSSTTKVALRINLDTVDVTKSDHFTAVASKGKFGISPAEAICLAERFHIDGLQCHFDACVLNKEILYKSRDIALDLVERFESKRLHITYVDVGGSFGTPYEETQKALNIPEVINELISPFLSKDIMVFMEPGRSLVAQSGLLVTRVEYVKNAPEANFALVDAGMNDLITPALYGDYYRILTDFEPISDAEKTELSEATSATIVEKTLKLSESFRLAEKSKPMPSPRLSRRIDSMPRDITGSRESFDELLNELQGNKLFNRTSEPPVAIPRTCRRSSPPVSIMYHIVGPLSERSDFLALSRPLPRLKMADLLVVTDVGAYGYSMSSNYSSRNKPPQIMILSNGKLKLISRRELLEDQLMLERNLETFIVQQKSI